MILELKFAGKTRQECFSNLKKNINEIEKQVIEENITGCWGVFGNGNKGRSYMVLNNSGEMIRKYKTQKKNETTHIASI